MLTFKYLGRIMMYDGSDVPAAHRQLKCTWAMSGRLSKTISKESMPALVAGMFYQAVVTAVLFLRERELGASPLADEGSGGIPCRVCEAPDWNDAQEGKE